MTDINASRYAVWRLSLVLDKFDGEFGDMVRALLARADASETELCAAKAEAERLRGALEGCVRTIEAVIEESEREIDYGEEDPFRMGEWFEDVDFERLRRARAALQENSHD